MPSRTPKPVITHTEILCYAIRHLESHINQWHESFASLPQDYLAFMSASERTRGICAREIGQLDALKQMYLFETGTEYR